MQHPAPLGLVQVAGSLAVILLPASSPRAASFEQTLEAGAGAYSAGKLDSARACFEHALEHHSGHFVALRWLSRVESELGEEAKGEDQRRLFALAVEHARSALGAAPESASSHLELAIALGRQALHEGPRTRLALSREVKAEADRAIALDATLGHAYHVRGMWNRKIAGLGFFERTTARAVLGGVPKGASMENAVADFERAIELEPNDVNHHLELGRTWLELNREDDARRELERAAALPPTSSPRDPAFQQEARTLLKKLKGR